MIGEVLSGYKLTQKLGEGGLGETYLAEHMETGQQAAVKVLFPPMCTDAAVIDRFFTDAKAASLINHVGIADLYDCGVHANGRAYLVIEYLVGKTLTDALIELGSVSDLESLADIAWQLATMLRAAHESKILHCALKPDGIFLTFPPDQSPRPLVKLLDFGMAKFTLNVRHSQTGSLLGAPLYMSPEIGRGMSTVDHRADIYSLGCIMFELACGRPPFVREGRGELIIAHATDAAPFVSSLEPSFPPAIDKLIGSMLTKNPAARPKSMADVATVLEKFFKCPLPVANQAVQATAPAFPSPVVAAPVPASPPIADRAMAPDVPSAPQPVNRGIATSETIDIHRTMISQPMPVANLESNPQPRRQDPTALLLPSEKDASSTQLEPAGKPSLNKSWIERVRQQTMMFDAPPKIGAKVRPALPLSSERSRPSSRLRPGQNGRAAMSAGRQAVPSFSLPIVVISASVLVVFAVVVFLLFARGGASSTQKKTPLTPAPITETATEPVLEAELAKPLPVEHKPVKQVEEPSTPDKEKPTAGGKREKPTTGKKTSVGIW